MLTEPDFNEANGYENYIIEKLEQNPLHQHDQHDPHQNDVDSLDWIIILH